MWYIAIKDDTHHLSVHAHMHKVFTLHSPLQSLFSAHVLSIPYPLPIRSLANFPLLALPLRPFSPLLVDLLSPPVIFSRPPPLISLRLRPSLIYPRLLLPRLLCRAQYGIHSFAYLGSFEFCVVNYFVDDGDVVTGI